MIIIVNNIVKEKYLSSEELVFGIISYMYQ